LRTSTTKTLNRPEEPHSASNDPLSSLAGKKVQSSAFPLTFIEQIRREESGNSKVTKRQ
jgi:hypothetical protein